MASPRRPENQEVIAKVEKVFEDIAHSLLREEELSIPLRYKKPASSQPDTELSTILTNVSFPARTPQEARRFTVLLRILELIHQALCNDEVLSKRNIYYKDPALFKTQHVVDKYVDIFAYTFGIQRAALNVTAAAKGLVVGDYSILHKDGTVTHQDPETAHLIHESNGVERIDTSRVAWILVVEKESTFRTLASSRLHQTCRAGQGIILTVHLTPKQASSLLTLRTQAKGYPDISSRAFLHHLATSQQLQGNRSPIYALTDFDPDGMAIMSTYKHGSYNLSHENSQLLVPSIRWLGIQSSDMLSSTDGEEFKSSLKLSGRDRNKAMKMLENSAVLWEDGKEPEWRRELQVMLMLNVKAEMEILADRDGGVAGWVEGKLLDDDGPSSRMVVDEDATTTCSSDDDDLGR